ncbi:MAG: hypothetical protein EA402_03300 [Planctomycetota bacterium]|nr:MAG: hypothetical protein EA402_03300 [Planctomycetota bacterium]
MKPREKKDGSWAVVYVVERILCEILLTDVNVDDLVDSLVHQSLVDGVDMCQSDREGMPYVGTLIKVIIGAVVDSLPVMRALLDHDEVQHWAKGHGWDGDSRAQLAEVMARKWITTTPDIMPLRDVLLNSKSRAEREALLLDDLNATNGQAKDSVTD